MTSTESQEVIRYIDQGTVIDHIPAGRALDLINMLGLQNHKNRMSLGVNLPSTHHGKKDMIKIGHKEFTPDEVNCIALFAPEATISIIRDHNVAKKFQVALPETIIDCAPCPNANCITHQERVKSVFHVTHESGNTKLCCHYCQKTFTQDQL